MGVVATNVLGNVWKSDNDDSENTATSDTDLLVLKGQVKMELFRNEYSQIYWTVAACPFGLQWQI